MIGKKGVDLMFKVFVGICIIDVDIEELLGDLIKYG